MSAALALIIATDRYNDAGLRRLRGPAQDAAALGEVLADPAIGGYTVRTVVNQPAHVVNEEIEAFFTDRLLDDLLLLYVSCHGVKDDHGRLYFASSNTKLRRLAATAISSVFVGEQMDQCRSRKIVLLLDCCYSGAFARGMVPRAAPPVDVHERFDGRGRVVITASTAMEYAFEVGGAGLSGSGTPSLFTGALVRGLRTGDADRDGDGRISVDELYDYVYESVRDARSGQTPSMVSNVQGELYVASSLRGGSPASTATALPTAPAAAPRPVTAPPPVTATPPVTAPAPAEHPPRREAARRQFAAPRAVVAVAAAVAVAAIAVLTLLLLNRPTTEPQQASTLDPTLIQEAPTGTLPALGMQGTARLSDPTEGFDLVAGTPVELFASHIAWNETAKLLYVFDETTLGASNLGRVPFDSVTAERLASLRYGQGSANPPLSPSDLPAGSVLAIRVNADTYVKLLIVAYEPNGDLQFRWATLQG